MVSDPIGHLSHKKDAGLVWVLSILLSIAILKESTCQLRHIATEKSGLCQYAVCIIQNTTLKSSKQSLNGYKLSVCEDIK